MQDPDLIRDATEMAELLHGNGTDTFDGDAARMIRRLIAALSPAPEGWRVVPVEPTEAMKAAGFGPFLGAHDPAFSANEPCGPIWKAMLSAAPLPVIGGGKESGSDVAADGAPVSERRPTPDAELITYVLRYGGMCRDCADENGVCPSSGLPCEEADKAVRHVLDALRYGHRHGFINASALLTAGTPP